MSPIHYGFPKGLLHARLPLHAKGIKESMGSSFNPNRGMGIRHKLMPIYQSNEML